MRRVGRVVKAGAVAWPRARRVRGASFPTWTAPSHSRARWVGSSSTALTVDGLIVGGLGLTVVIAARVSRKVERDKNKRITLQRDPRPFCWGYFLHRYLDEFDFSLVSPPGTSNATETIAVMFLQSGVDLPGTCVVLLIFVLFFV